MLAKHYSNTYGTCNLTFIFNDRFLFPCRLSAASQAEQTAGLFVCELLLQARMLISNCCFYISVHAGMCLLEPECSLFSCYGPRDIDI